MLNKVMAVRAHANSVGIPEIQDNDVHNTAAKGDPDEFLDDEELGMATPMTLNGDSTDAMHNSSIEFSIKPHATNRVSVVFHCCNDLIPSTF